MLYAIVFFVANDKYLFELKLQAKFNGHKKLNVIRVFDNMGSNYLKNELDGFRNLIIEIKL